MQQSREVNQRNEPVPNLVVITNLLQMQAQWFTLHGVHTVSVVPVMMTGMPNSKLPANSMQASTWASAFAWWATDRRSVQIHKLQMPYCAVLSLHRLYKLANKDMDPNRHQSKVGGVSPLPADLLSPQQPDPHCCTAAASALNSACICTNALLELL